MKKLLMLAVALTTVTVSFGQHWRNYAEKPPMGWNSFNCFGATVLESEVKANADFIDKNLKDLGWNYVVVDFCWFYPSPPGSTRSNPPQSRLSDGSLIPWFPMDEFGRLYPDVAKFPSAADGNGFKALGEYIHSKGLKFGIHLMRGVPRQAVFAKSKIKGTDGIDASMIADTVNVCPWLNSMYGVDMSKEGAQEYYDSLFELYAEWEVDFVKYDDFAVSGKGLYCAAEVEAVRKAIDKCGRPMVLSLSPGMLHRDGQHLNKHANMWRISADFWDTWEQLLEQFDLCAEWNDTRTYGTWPDADMLQLGRLSRRGPVGKERNTGFTADEQKSHFTMWCIYKSPLMMGGDLTVSTPETIEMLQNKDLIYINQYAENPRQTLRDENTIIWTSDHHTNRGIKYVAIFNISDKDAQVKVKAADYITGKHTIRDIWAGTPAKRGSSVITAKVPKHGVVIYELKK